MHFTPTATPNPNALKFTSETRLFERRIEIKKGSVSDSELLTRLLAIDGVDSLFGINDFITVNKVPSAQWDDVLPQVEAVLDKF